MLFESVSSLLVYVSVSSLLVYVSVYLCVCVCGVCARTYTRIEYIYECVCVPLIVWYVCGVCAYVCVS